LSIIETKFPHSRVLLHNTNRTGFAAAHGAGADTDEVVMVTIAAAAALEAVEAAEVAGAAMADAAAGAAAGDAGDGGEGQSLVAGWY
jgi:hypothetical protein